MIDNLFNRFWHPHKPKAAQHLPGGPFSYKRKTTDPSDDCVITPQRRVRSRIRACMTGLAGLRLSLVRVEHDLNTILQEINEL